MSLSTLKTDSVRFDKPQDKVKWIREFRGYAKDLELWDFIKPEGKIPWLTRPIAPMISSYPRKLVRSVETRASSAATSQTQTEEIDMINPPTTALEMTAEGRSSYQIDRAFYQDQTKAYDRHRENLTTLKTWVRTTTSAIIRQECCHEDESVDNWYEEFEKYGAPYEALHFSEARTRYLNAVKPLQRIPKKFDEWVTEWTTAMTEGHRTKIPETENPEIWAKDLIRALQHVLPSWANGFLQVYRSCALNSGCD
jgi:hypothetical protein